ncbi:MAG: phenylalanine--tRNA ligase beta subunit-related protein [Ilumatobacter fluminis]|uniref:B3/B4 domain-containing protein n=1 Tax=Ilumatobacter fluminis TaxID=467091 RepID=UPI0032F06368
MIDASEWVQGAVVDAAVSERWPDYRVWLVAADEIDASLVARTVDELFEAAASSRLAAPDTHVLQWQQAFRDFGVKPRVARSSVDALLRRAGSERGLPRIDPLVDLYNAVSVLHRVPIGGEDLDRYQGGPHLMLASGDEPFPTIDHGDEVVDHPDPGEPIWTDDDGVTCRRWNWRQPTRTAIGPATHRVGFIIDSLDAPDHEGAQAAADLLASFLPNAFRRMIGGGTG